jgi:hypothetical protein
VWTTALIRFESLFWNPTERRLRAGIRVCIYFGLWGFGPALLHVVVGPRLTLALGGDLRWLASILLDLLRLAVVLFALWLVARFVDHRPFVAYGLRIDRHWWVDLVFGIALGMLLMTAIFAVELATGWVTVTGYWSAPAGVPFCRGAFDAVAALCGGSCGGGGAGARQPVTQFRRRFPAVGVHAGRRHGVGALLAHLWGVARVQPA